MSKSGSRMPGDRAHFDNKPKLGEETVTDLNLRNAICVAGGNSLQWRGNVLACSESNRPEMWQVRGIWHVPCNLSFIPGPWMVEGENRLQKLPSISTYMHIK